MRLQFGDCVFDSTAREVRRQGRGVALTPKGFQLLDLLIQHRPNAMSKQDIQNALWPEIFVSEANLPNLVGGYHWSPSTEAKTFSVLDPNR